MLIEQIRTISYICPECGTTHFENISMFDFSGKSQIEIHCKCQKSHLTISKTSHKDYIIHVPCLGCGNIHQYNFKFYDVWMKPINSICCKVNRTEILFLGNTEEVLNQLDMIDEKKEKVASIIGYEKIFANSAVMLQTIDKIHEIAEQDKIVCECGGNEFFVEAKSDKILLSCKDCGTFGFVNANNNFDLKSILQKNSIIICKNKQYI